MFVHKVKIYIDDDDKISEFYKKSVKELSTQRNYYYYFIPHKQSSYQFDVLYTFLLSDENINLTPYIIHANILPKFYNTIVIWDEYNCIKLTHNNT